MGIVPMSKKKSNIRSFCGLRQILAKKLKKAIGHEEIEKKELKALREKTDPEKLILERR